ncbi:histidine phosphatase family protein [Curtobacterium sp. MCBD17_032]|uniref:histidine phosphatase family protein n=1 Tax=Curtobacterium sp. MCBD17_032 TaxID=2175659 RepID=UPI000DA8593B|nr:histidine phosphatase family protein [Curtobacterium sp. MCBD17_032]PZE80644.1 histidine phosphatase family protein [Curtobacterium sp. MCBD17_032]
MLCAWVSHPEVIVDPAVRIQDWGLSSVGRARAARIPSLLPQPLRIVSSSERKALDTAAIIAGRWGTEVEVDEDLGELDRSATGYLEPSDFEPTVDAFFAEPQRSVRGWERAADAQDRVERAVRRIAAQTPERGIAFIAHGGVGALLLASLRRERISRALDQPAMGSSFTFDPQDWTALSSWERSR